MVASTKAQTLTKGFDFVSILIEFANDPKGLLAELEKEVIRINTLNEEQTKQYEDAISLMQQRDSLLREISDLRKQFSDEKTSQEADAAKRKADIDKYVSDEEAKIQKANEALDKREFDLNDYSTRLDQRENLLKEKAAVVNGLFGE